jgi:hypothetical protein
MTKPDKAPTAADAVAAEVTKTPKRRGLNLSSFLPAADFLAANLTSKGKGAKLVIGRVYGLAFGTASKEELGNDLTPTTKVVVTGDFVSEQYSSKTTSSASSVQLTNAFTSALAKVLKDNPAVEIDVDIVLEATGAKPPYTVSLLSHIKPEDGLIIKRLGARRL